MSIVDNAIELEYPQYVHRERQRDYDQSMGITLRTFGARIKWLLDQPEHGSGMSQKELAAAVGLSEQFTGALILGKRNPNVRHLQAFAKTLKTSVSFLALTTDDPAPETAEAAPVYFSPQADEAAQLVDGMSDELREVALDLLRVLMLHDVDDDADPAHTSGGASGRLILGKLFKNVKKSAEYPRPPLRSNSE